MAEEERLSVLALVAIGVGSALGGDFFGWQLVLAGQAHVHAHTKKQTC